MDALGSARRAAWLGAAGRGHSSPNPSTQATSCLWTISEWVPERRFTWVARGPGVRIVAEHSLRPDPRGCVVEHRVRFEGILRGIAGRVYGRLVSHYLNQETDGLRSRSEQASTLAPGSRVP
jgi:hypothetical protein